MSRQAPSERPWSVPVAVTEVPEAGRHVDLVADAATREAVAKAAGIAALPRLEASFDLTRQGRDGLRVTGRVRASVVQNCVVTLEPVDDEVDDEIDLVFMPQPELTPPAADVSFNPADSSEPPEMLRDGSVDLGALATEFLILGIDPYPRKPGVVFEAPPAGDPSSHPFAALAALRKADPGTDS